MRNHDDLLVDPEVSKRKFDREIANYKALQHLYLPRGWCLLSASFPEVLVMFVATQLKPSPVVFGVLLNFDNYDIWPPSVQLVNPFTRIPYKISELLCPLLRKVRSDAPTAGTTSPTATNAAAQKNEEVVALVQAHGENSPFICLPGVREYHAHPAHSGDSWFLQRKTGAGTLHFILENLHKYGVLAIKCYYLQIQVQQVGVAFDMSKVPT